MTLKNLKPALIEADNIPTSEAVFLKKLVEIVGQKMTASLVGYSPTAISYAVKTGRCRLTLELAARYIFETRYESNKPPVSLALVQCKESTLNTIKDMVAVIGGSVTDIDS
jgi:hypothetical protein